MFPEVQAPRGTADANVPILVPVPAVVHHTILPEISRAAWWRSLPEFLFVIAMTVSQYRRKRAYLGRLGLRRKHAVRKARWHIR